MSRTPASAFLLLLAVCGLSQANTPGGQAVFSSGDHRVALIELYTSEGCSSCPPADRWLSNLKNDGGLWTDYVPIAFHVDYWDYIGWKDRFSRRGYSDRQRRYADEGGTRVVYTPGFFRDGRDWRGWRKGAVVESPTIAVGTLTVLVDNQSAEIRFDSLDSGSRRLTANVALLGMNLETSVRAGENEGRTLRHDFVALDTTSVSLSRVGAAYEAETPLPATDSGNKSLALAVWISEEGSQTPIQSTGGYLTTTNLSSGRD